MCSCSNTTQYGGDVGLRMFIFNTGGLNDSTSFIDEAVTSLEPFLYLDVLQIEMVNKFANCALAARLETSVTPDPKMYGYDVTEEARKQIMSQPDFYNQCTYLLVTNGNNNIFRVTNLHFFKETISIRRI